MKTDYKVVQRARIKRRIRAKISGTPERPRLSVFRSNKHIAAQLIDDVAGHTLASASTYEAGVETTGKTAVELSTLVGQLMAERAAAQGITQVVFDRNGYRYHGRVKAVADAARAGGLQF